MALHTKKAFAEMCGMKTGNLSNMVARQKVVYSGDYVDDSIEPNKSFLEQRKAKAINSGEPEAAKAQVEYLNPKVSKPQPPKQTTPNVSINQQAVEIAALMAEKTNTQIEKMRIEMDKIRLQNSKFMGEVIPSGLIKPVILQHNLSIITESKNMLDNITRILAKKYGIPPDEVANFKSEYIKELNVMIKKASGLTSKSVTNIINEFAEKKSVGERE